MAELIDEKVLAELAAERDRNLVQIALEATLPLLHNRKNEIENIFESERLKTALTEVMIILGSEIEEVVKGKMIVPEYSQKGSAKQEIYVFIGTHWELAKIQIYYDFIKEACRKIGLSEVYVQDQTYMNKVFENVAFRVSKHIATVQPHDGVWINLRNGTLEICPSPLTLPQMGGSEMPSEEGNQAISGVSTPSHLGEGRGEGPCLHFREHRSSDFFLYCLPYDYDPEAECPRWLSFLDDVLPEKESQSLLGEYIGYCFTQNLKLEKMAVFYGGGANGKSVTLDVIKRLFGRTNVSEATLSSVTNDPEARSTMQNKLVNISSESGKNLNSAILKMLISGEAVEMRILYVGTKLLYNPPKLITSYNELPPVENNHAYRRRWILFPFNRTIADDKQDHSLTGKLALELPGILNWVLGHLRNLVQRVNQGTGEDFTNSQECNNALSAYFKSANSASMFVEECCTMDDNISNKLKDIYLDYQNYCRCSGITKPVILKNFKKVLLDCGAKESRMASVRYLNVYVDKSVYD